MLLLGAYFLLSAIVIPNIASSLTKDFGTVSAGSSSGSIVAVVVMIIILVIIGIFLNKKSKNLLD